MGDRSAQRAHSSIGVTIMVIAALAAVSQRAHSCEAENLGVPGSEKPPEAKKNVMTLADQTFGETIACSGHADGGITLGEQPQRIILTPATSLLASPRTSLASRLRSLASDHAIYIVFEGLSAQTPPGNVYNAFFDLEEAVAPPDASDPRYMGTLQFYDAPDAAERKSAKSVAFNVTNLLRKLHELNKAQMSVTLVPVGSLAEGARPRIAEIKLVMK
ncbi:hypothetical protein [Methylocystis sp.]|uniref:hypothetical protein n=1 Tax=Methylocystis sp. TaxID=1911079 RepID=UPI003DA61D04